MIYKLSTAQRHLSNLFLKIEIDILILRFTQIYEEPRIAKNSLDKEQHWRLYTT